MELREAAMELQEENLSLREKVSHLESQIKKAKDLKLKDEAYWIDGDTVPFCQVCFDKDGKLIHLLDGKDLAVIGNVPCAIGCSERNMNLL